MISFYLFDRWGNQIGTISNVLSAVHVDELNGEDSLTIEFEEQDVIKGQRIVWKDKFGNWHEHIISDFTVHHADGRLYTSAYCENSISELLTDYIVWKRPNANAAACLSIALQNSRWLNGQVTALGNVKTSWYHVSAYEAVTDIVEQIGAELQTTITVTGSTVSSRAVDILSRRGGDYGRLFVYGRNLTGIERIIEPDDVYTALYGYGKGLPVYDDNGEATGGYSNKLTFGEVNGGVDWIGDEDARKIWGVPDGNGGIKHAFGKVEFDDCEDPDELLALTKQALDHAKHPKITYTGTVISMAETGLTNGRDVQTGDTVHIQDKDLNERLEGRVLKVERNLLDEASTVITLGNLISTLTSSVNAQQAEINSIKNRATNWDGASAADPAWLEQMVNNMNNQFAIVNNYRHESFEHGDIWATVPLDANGHPLQTPGSAIQINSAGFRIANTINSNGEFEWRTFGTGEGFTADYINAGVIRGGANWWDLSSGNLEFLQGRIGSTDNLTYWDLTNKAFRLTEADGHGIIYENGKLNIDASSVYIGTTTIQNWTRDQYEEIYGDLSGEISDLEKTIQTEIRTEISALEGQIKLKVSSGDVQSAITAALGKIDLTVTGALGSSASIKISADGKQLDSASLNLSGVRKAFAEDNKTNITISAGTLTFNGTAVTTFNGNTFVVNSTNFSVTKEGKITAKSGTIGGFTITDKSLYNGKTSLSSGTGVYVGTDGIGLGSNFYVDKSGNGKIGNFTFNSGKLYTGSKTALSNTSSGVYIASDGISLGANFKVTNAGVLTASSGTIGGFTIGADRLTGKQVILSSNIIDFRSSNSDASYLGSVGGTWYSNGSTRFVSLMTNTSISYNYGIMFSFTGSSSLGVGKETSAGNIKGCLSKAKTGVLSAGWNWYSNHDFHGYTIKNAVLDTDTVKWN